MAGRSAFTGEDVPALDALRTCVHCGICLPACPTYRVLGEEMDSPRGRLYLMRAAAEGRQALTPAFARHLDLCLGCRACETACPAGVPFGTLLEATRAQLVRQGKATRPGLVGRLAFTVFPNRRRFRAALGLGRLYRASGARALARATRLARLFPRLDAMDALLPPAPSAAAALPELVPARGPRRGRVALLTGCVQDALFADVNRDTARLLALAGWDVVVPRAQGCCGALDLHAGHLRPFRARARRLAAAFPADVDWIVTTAAGCGSTMREYAHWLPDAAVGRLAARTRDVSQLLVDADLPLGRLNVSVTYHDACHLAHGQKVRSEPRALLRGIPGLELLELVDSDVCCGSAGVYNVLEPGMADRLLALKVERVLETGARVVATGNPGCVLQIARGCRERGAPIEVVHPVTLLARAVDAHEAAAAGTRETTR